MFGTKKIAVKKISGSNNKIENEAVCANVSYDIVGNNNHIIIKKGVILANMMIYMRGDDHVLIISEKCRYSGGSVWFEDHHCKIEIGEGSTFESAHLAATEPNCSITVGKDCMFSNEIEVRTGDSHSIIDELTKERINYAENVALGDHVWVGAKATILKGVNIGSNSIISTGAIVTSDIPANSIAAGIPAKVIKTGVNWLRKRIYK